MAEEQRTGTASATAPSAGDRAAAPRMPKAREPDGLSGDRAALPANTLSKPFFAAQGDENRDPPPIAPVPPQPGVTLPPAADTSTEARSDRSGIRRTTRRDTRAD